MAVKDNYTFYMKSYTDLEQSKKLAEILPLKSADMYFNGHQSITNPKEWEYEDAPKVRGKYIAFDDKRIFYPCWSLAALLKLLPLPMLTQHNNGKWCIVSYPNGAVKTSNEYDNPVDACYEMIVKLKELNLL